MTAKVKTPKPDPVGDRVSRIREESEQMAPHLFSRLLQRTGNPEDALTEAVRCSVLFYSGFPSALEVELKTLHSRLTEEAQEVARSKKAAADLRTAEKAREEELASKAKAKAEAKAEEDRLALEEATAAEGGDPPEGGGEDPGD